MPKEQKTTILEDGNTNKSVTHKNVDIEKLETINQGACPQLQVFNLRNMTSRTGETGSGESLHGSLSLLTCSRVI